VSFGNGSRSARIVSAAVNTIGEPPVASRKHCCRGRDVRRALDTAASTAESVGRGRKNVLLATTCNVSAVVDVAVEDSRLDEDLADGKRSDGAEVERARHVAETDDGATR
jgi:hypothetical protein